jgi:acyl carrier protein
MRCFRAVFGALTPEEIPAASAEWVAGWDSVATVTLAAVIEEEFGIQFDASELEQITSFSGILAILERRMRD